MKKFLIFTIILLSSFSKIFSCGFDPYGEDLRYSLFLPEYFEYKDFTAFNYNTNSFGFDYEYKNQYESNVYDWYNYVNKKVSLDAINECMNTLKYTDINATSTNEFVQYLYKNKLNSAVQYLIIAKQCEDFNNFDRDDLWERNSSFQLNISSLLTTLNKLIDTEKSDYFKRKYAFLTIRTAYYESNNTLIKNLFEKHFSKGKKDYLYYWALFFNSFQNENPNDIANVMVNSVEKKYACYYYFHEHFKLKEALQKAQSKDDIANLYAFASLQRLEPNLDYLRKIYENSNKSRILGFLLLREINKIEDWVYTPYYTNYLPSMEYAEYWWANKKHEKETTTNLRLRSEKDRLYANEVLNFINSIDFSKIKDVSLWKAAQIQLLFITKNYDECLNKIKVFEKQYAKEKVYNQIEKIKALCLISNQEVRKAKITKEAKAIILKYLTDEHFMFSIGRELEFRRNLPDGLALIAYGNKNKNIDIDLERDNTYFNNSVYWQGNRLKNSGNLKYFSEYFDYLDFVYSADELQIIINKLNTKPEDEFNKIIYSQLLDDKNYLKDLLGTKYIRENRLNEAVKTFESLGQTYWDENYNSWERDKFEDYYTFDMNPFYDIKHTFSFIPHIEKYIVTKLTVTQHLIKYLNLATNPRTEERDYYYFLVANCYLNMTQYGHSWMMRRYNTTSNYNEGNNESYLDEIEYRNGNLAQKYFQLAFDNAKTDMFKALCLRMEDYAKENINTKFKKLKTFYPQYYNDLSSCINLEEYFKNRR